jgi:hypothetical protein
MAPIDNAIAAIERLGPGEHFSYRKVAEEYNIQHSTLRRRYQGLCAPRAGEAQNRQKLSPQQELQLVQYIEDLTERGLPPTRAMIRNLGGDVAGVACSDAWVSQFLRRNKHLLTSKWTSGMDRNRHKADSKDKYEAYFDLLHSKIQEYKVEPENIYNMDEKGFLMGITGRSKRVFSKQFWEQKRVTAAVQDGSREWITVIACVCADGSALPPGLVYQGITGLQSSWLEDVQAGKHEAFFANSPTGWSNNSLGLAWLEQVFQRYTAEKARRRWRLLILDGHASHLNMDFIQFCYAQKILLAVFPPHATHSLQLLDVVLFGPLASCYSQELVQYLHNSQGLMAMRKGDFFLLFHSAWMSSFKEETVRKSFEATGIHPMNAEVILKRYKTATSSDGNDLGISAKGNRSSWRELHHLLDDAVEGGSGNSAEAVGVALHSLQVLNELLHHENKGLRTSLSTKKKRNNKSNTMDLQQRKEFQSSAVFWSPRKVREACVREDMKQQEAEEGNLQKSQRKELKAAAALYKKQQLAEAKVERERIKEVKKKGREDKAKRLAASRAEKQRQKESENTQKALQLSQRGKRPASEKVAPKSKRARGAVGLQVEVVAAEEAPPEPPKQSRTRTIRRPNRYFK